MNANTPTTDERMEYAVTQIQGLSRKIEILQEQIDHLHDSVSRLIEHAEREDRPF